MVTFCVPTVDYDLRSFSDISSCATPVCRQVSMTTDSNTNWTALGIALSLSQMNSASSVYCHVTTKNYYSLSQMNLAIYACS